MTEDLEGYLNRVRELEAARVEHASMLKDVVQHYQDLIFETYHEEEWTRVQTELLVQLAAGQQAILSHVAATFTTSQFLIFMILRKLLHDSFPDLSSNLDTVGEKLDKLTSIMR